MSTTYHYLSGYSDDQGEPCVHCQLEGHENQANVYTTNSYTGLELHHCCLDCIDSVILTYNNGDDVLVEVGKQ
jgi:hypothetical protein